jgi:hypothetical protein
LGGSPRSLEFKYKTAADLFHKGTSERIWILSIPGKTEFSRDLERNLTNDEWSIQKLKELGVPEQKVEAIKIEGGFFGTFSEAKTISSLLKGRGYKDIVLISSDYHTKRIKISFDNFLKDKNTSIYAGPAKSGCYLTWVQGSGEKLLLRHFIIEFIKLKVYQYLLVS